VCCVKAQGTMCGGEAARPLQTVFAICAINLMQQSARTEHGG
jgi:hypothetical protein